MNQRFAGKVPLALFFCLLLPAACKEKPREQLYFDDLKPPLGSGKVTVVSDTSLNPASGGEITVLASVEPEIDKDELDRLMKSLFRQASGRRGFVGDGKPVKIDLRFYDSEDKAKSGGDNWLSRAHLAPSAPEPEYANRQKAPLLKWVKKAIGPQPQFTGKPKPQILADAVNMTLELDIPMISDDGSGQYVPKLTFEKLTTELSSYSITLFEKIPDLKKLTFIARHEDKVAAKIVMNEKQFNELNLKQVEESLGAHHGAMIEMLLTKGTNEKHVEALVTKKRREVYRETLAKLPAEQVELDKSLR